MCSKNIYCIGTDTVNFINLEDVYEAVESGICFSELMYHVNGYEGKNYIISCIVMFYNSTSVGGRILLFIEKKKGLKSYFSVFEKLFKNCSIEIFSSGETVIKIEKKEASIIEIPEKFNYCNQFVYISNNLRIVFSTKVGMFSYKKIDKGSDFLVQTLLEKKIIKQNMNVLDFGCGYGAIGISLAMSNPYSNFYLLDNDKKCITMSLQNIKNNNLNNCSVLLSDGTTDLHNREGFDLIVSHFPMHIAMQLKKKLLKQLSLVLKRECFIVFVVLNKYNFDTCVNDYFRFVDKCVSKTDPEYQLLFYKVI